MNHPLWVTYLGPVPSTLILDSCLRILCCLQFESATISVIYILGIKDEAARMKVTPPLAVAPLAHGDDMRVYPWGAVSLSPRQVCARREAVLSGRDSLTPCRVRHAVPRGSSWL